MHLGQVLVVEDDNTQRKSAVALVKRCGYRPLEASNAMEALAAMHNGCEADIVLMDVSYSP